MATSGQAQRETRVLVGLAAIAATAVLLVATTAALVAPVWPGSEPADEGTAAPPATTPAAGLVGPPAAAAPTVRVALAIAGDDGLRRLADDRGWPGEGTAEDPIRMTLALDVTDSTGLRLSGTSLHLVIEEASVTVSGQGDAIQIDDAHNVHVERSHLTGGTAGIRIRNSEDVVVANSTIEHGRFGVLLQGASGIVVRESRLAFNGIGLYAEPARAGEPGSERVQVLGNTLLGNDDPAVKPGGGVVLAGNGHRVTQNLLAGNGFAGVWLLGSTSEVSENRFDGGRERAIVVHGGKDVVVRDNRVQAHRAAAIVGHGTTGLVVVGNQVADAVQEGVRVGHDTASRIEANEIGGSASGIVAFASEGLLVAANAVRHAEQAVDLVEVDHAIVRDNTISDVVSGAINLFGAHDVALEDNRMVRSAGHGVFVGKASSDIRLVGNDLSKVLHGITVDGDSQRIHSERDVILGPCVTGVNVLEADHVRLTATDVLRCDVGVALQRGEGHRIEGGAYVANVVGVSLGRHVAPVHVEGVTAQQNAAAVQVIGSTNHLVTSSDLAQNTQGVVLVDAAGIEIAHNWVRDNRIGLHFVNATGNRIYDNLIVNDGLPGAQDHLMQNSPGNHWNVTERDGPNVVGGPRIGGNLWRDYDGPDTDQDGLGDVPYWPVPATTPNGTVLGMTISLEGPLDMHPLVTEGDPERGPSPAVRGDGTGKGQDTDTDTEHEAGRPIWTPTPDLPLRHDDPRGVEKEPSHLRPETLGDEPPRRPSHGATGNAEAGRIE